MTDLALSAITKSFGAVSVLHGIDLDVRDGEFVVFVGPSGCGKSTLLRIIAGLETASSGSIRLGGADVTQVAAADRGLAMVFQSYALYPHMTVRQNLAFGLENIRAPRAEIDARIAEAARMLQIEPLLGRKPRQLSGGQRQRVAIGRAMVRRPAIFLLDEPLSNLDAELRVATRAELAALRRRLGATMIYVTHDQVEAMTLADRIVVLRAGRIEQVGAPLALFNDPANRFVAGFIGSPRMNFLVAQASGPAEILLPGGTRVGFAPAGPLTTGAAVTVGFRPQHAVPAMQGLPLQVAQVEQLGTETVVHCTAASGDAVLLALPGQQALAAGETLHIELAATPFLVFGEDGRRIRAQA